MELNTGKRAMAYKGASVEMPLNVRKSLLDVEYDFDHTGGNRKNSKWDSLVDAKRIVAFQPMSPKPPRVEVKGREVFLAITTFLFISVCIGLIMSLVAMHSEKVDIQNETFCFFHLFQPFYA